VSDTGLREALEELLQRKESEPDRRPRDKYGPIGRKPDLAIRVSVLRDLLAAHPAEPAPVEHGVCNACGWEGDSEHDVCPSCGQDELNYFFQGRA
jgi:hypothetical protein